MLILIKIFELNKIHQTPGSISVVYSSHPLYLCAFIINQWGELSSSGIDKWWLDYNTFEIHCIRYLPQVAFAIRRISENKYTSTRNMMMANLSTCATPTKYHTYAGVCAPSHAILSRLCQCLPATIPSTPSVHNMWTQLGLNILLWKLFHSESPSFYSISFFFLQLFCVVLHENENPHIQCECCLYSSSFFFCCLLFYALCMLKLHKDWSPET